jgi:hypothetical protein
MHSTYLREIYPDVVKNLDDNFINRAKSVLIKNTDTEFVGIGFIFRESDIDTNFVKEYLTRLNIPITKTLEELIEISVSSDSTLTSVVLGVPNPLKKEDNDRVWIWLNGFGNDIIREKFKISSEIDPNLELAQVRIDYRISTDTFIGHKEYYGHIDKKDTYTNYTFWLDENNEQVKLAHEQNCFHDYRGASMFSDLDGIIEKIPSDLFKFQSFSRSSNTNCGLYIGIKNRGL